MLTLCHRSLAHIFIYHMFRSHIGHPLVHIQESYEYNFVKKRFLDPNRASPEGVYRNGLSSTKMSHYFDHAIVVTLLWSRYCGHAIVVTLLWSHYCHAIVTLLSRYCSNIT